MIGVFDSGVGGLSVLSEIRRLMPTADLLYVGDQARAPYGPRSLDEVNRIAHEIAEWLITQGSKVVVVACNTASAAALDSIRRAHPDVEVVGMEPAVKPAASLSESHTIGVFATAATFQGQLFDSVVHRHASGTRVLTMSCPEWVEIVERGVVRGRNAEKRVTRAVNPIVEGGADVLVLGCTHFSYLGELIEQVSGLPVIDPAIPVARRVASLTPEASGSATTRLLTSGDLDRFKHLVEKLTDLNGEFGRYPS